MASGYVTSDTEGLKAGDEVELVKCVEAEVEGEAGKKVKKTQWEVRSSGGGQKVTVDGEKLVPYQKVKPAPDPVAALAQVRSIKIMPFRYFLSESLPRAQA